MAVRKRFTNAQIKALTPKPQRYEVWEGGGFGMRVTPRGVKSWVWLYRFEGKARRVTFGTFPDITLHSARVALTTAQECLSKGEDPGKILKGERHAARQAETVTDVVNRYLTEYALPNKRSGPEDERILRKDVTPRWGHRKATSIKRRDVAELLRAIADRGAGVQANRTLSVVRRMFNWAMSAGILETNPAALAEGPGVETPRTRNLTPLELRTFWNGLAKSTLSEATQLGLQFMLVVAQRKGETIKAKKTDFDLSEDDPAWIIPAANAKNKRAHRVPLPPLAVSLYRKIEKLSGESEWLFPTPGKSDKPITARGVSQALLLNRDAIGVQDVVPHDMRRAASTGMASLGVPKFIRERVLNHSQGKLDQSYDLYEYNAEKRDALERWATRLTVILAEDKKVVELQAQTA